MPCGLPCGEPLGHAGRNALGDGEVDQLDLARAVDEDVVRLDVAMHPALGVHERQARGHLLEDVLALFADKSVSFRWMRSLRLPAGKNSITKERVLRIAVHV